MDRLRTPPIVEAILSFRVELPAAPDSGALDEFASLIEERFPVLSGPFDTLGGPDSSVREYRSADGSERVRVGMGEVTFHRLHPYPGWDAFREAGEGVWRAFRAAFEPARVERLGLRHLDRIEIPVPHQKVEDYLRLVPAVDWPFVSCLVRMVIPEDRIGALGQVTLTAEPLSSNADSAAFVLDTDVWREGSFSPSDAFIWGTVDQLRDFRERLFFDATTERTRELFQ